jgi:hypothetical protein
MKSVVELGVDYKFYVDAVEIAFTEIVRTFRGA